MKFKMNVVLHRGFHLIAIIIFAIACQPSAPVDKNRDTTAMDHMQNNKSLLEEAEEPLRNTEHFHSVEIKQMKFVPEKITVHKGDTIAWINNDIVVHDITEEKKKEWSSSALPVGKTWQKIIDKSDDYFCSIHVVMKGKIIVE
jgi:plastocyanin